MITTPNNKRNSTPRNIPTTDSHKFNLRLICQLLLSSLLTLSTLSLALGQEVEKDSSNKTQIITASVTPDGVRIAAPDAVVQLRLEVYDEAGQKLLDTEQRSGNVLDWRLEGRAGERVADGNYLCVVTIKNLSGQLSKKLGLATVSAGSTQLRPAAVAELSPQQTQAVGVIEAEDQGLSIVPAETAPSVSVLANNGDQAQLARTRGALTFRMGDFFSGADKEQMRLSEEGNLGIGTSKPKVRLDVAGMIRAREGFMFSDGSTLTVNDKGVLTRTSADGSTPSIASTQNSVAKFTDNAGTLGNSVITESASGNIGIGTPTPGALLDVSDNTNHLMYNPTTAKLTLTGPAQSLTANPGLRLDFNSDPDSGLSYLAYAHDNISMAFDAYWNGTSWVSSHLGSNFALYKNANQLAIGFNAGTGKGGTFPAFNTTTGVIFSNNGSMGIGGAPGSAKLSVNGNVGIGTTTPGAKLDVVGNIKISGANNGITFPDGTTMTTAAAGGGQMSGTQIVSAINDPATTGTINDNRLSANVARLTTANTFNGTQTVNGNAAILDPSNKGLRVQTNTSGGTVASFGGFGAFQIDAPGAVAGRFVVKDTGNVGIGTANPASKLQVAGTVESTSGGFKFPDGSVQTSAVSNSGIGKTYTNSLATEIEITRSGANVVALSLPAGIYMLNVTLEFENRANDLFADNTRKLNCYWGNPLGASENAYFRLGGQGSAMDHLPISVHTITNRSVDSSLWFYCYAQYGGDRSNVFIKRGRLTAIRLGDVVTQ